MSRTYRTDKEGEIAARRMKRDREGNLLLPRILRRNPRPGDIHPVSTRQIRKVFERLPLEYLYNLSSVEMLPRKDGIGDPFGVYYPDEKRIIMYSLPLSWELVFTNEADVESAALSLELDSFHAKVEIAANRLKVVWSDALQMGYWLCCIVLLHEFGHHFRSEYRAKRKAGTRIRRDDEEILADLKGYSAYREVFLKESVGEPQ